MAGRGRESYKFSLGPPALELSITTWSWLQEGPQCRPHLSEGSGTQLPHKARWGAAFLLPGQAGPWDTDTELWSLHMLAPSEDTTDAALRREGRGVWAWPGQVWAWGPREARA